MRTWQKLRLIALLGVVPLVGCDALGLGDDHSLTLSFVVPGTGGSNPAVRSAALLVDTLIGGGHVIDVQTVAVTFNRVVLERVGTDDRGDSDRDSDTEGADSDREGNEQLRSGPVTINLPLRGGVVTPTDAAVPNGDFDQLELKMSQVRFVGTFDGQPFDVVLPIKTELDIHLDPPFTVDSNTDRLNVTIVVDALSWFRDFQGRLLDPRLLNTNSSLRSFLVSRIKTAFRAFEDSDLDADEKDSDSDRGGHSGRG
jgi:hypothetical protein